MSKVIEVKNITKEYLHVEEQLAEKNLLSFFSSIVKRKKETKVLKSLDDISFDVSKGEAVALVGLNGAGKSTMLRILSRITKPSKGCFTINGTVNSLLELGVGFNEDLTGRENIFFNAALHGMKKSEIHDKLEEIVEFAEIDTFLDYPMKHFSTGMKLRLGFAIAAFMSSDILLVDEALAVGDIAFQKKCINKMVNDINQGRTVFFVSHQIDLLKMLCSRVIVLDHGKKVYDGEINRGIDFYYKNVFLNKFKTNIKDRSDREGTGVIRINDIYMLDAEGRKIEKPFAGQAVTVCLELFSKEKRDVFFDIAFKSETGAYIFKCNTNAINKLFVCEKGINVFCCDFKKFPLSIGTYIIDSWVYSNAEIFDRVLNAALFDVLEGNYWGNDFVDNSPYVYLDFDWRSVGKENNTDKSTK